jgi:hypothetical protein
MKRLLLYTLLLLCPLLAQAQSSWTGLGDGTSWNDDLNWNPAAVPAAGSTVTIGVSATITGIVPDLPSQVITTGTAVVTLDFNTTTTLGTGLTDAIIVSSSSSLIIASDINVAASSMTRAIEVTSSAELTIQSMASLTVLSASNGMLLRSGATVTNEGTFTVNNASSNGIVSNGGSFTNTGTINITALSTNGIQNSGVFENSGTINITDSSSRGIFNRSGGGFENNGLITITDAGSIGIRDEAGTFTNNQQITITNPGGVTNDGIRTDGSFTNTSSGSITVNEVNGDGVAVSAGTLTNEGVLEVIVPSASSGGNDGISIAPAATLDNNGAITVNGLGVSARLVRVDGNLLNAGEISLSGGSVNGRMLISGNVTNETGGELDMGNGRIDINGGNLTNDGFLTSMDADGILNSGTATNNGFYAYAGIARFARGAFPVDNGIDLNDPNDTSIDALGGNTVQIANAGPYDYFEGSTLVGTSDASGNITFNMTLSGTTVSLTNGLTGVTITVTNLGVSALPITLTSFTARPKGDQVMVEWETATELNNDYMAVERSADGRSFDEIGRVQGAGNSNTPIRYDLLDEEPLSGRSYYRLRQVDFDGTTSYSDVRSVSFASASGGSIQVYPTVSNGKESLTIELPQTGQQGNVNLDIFHVSGALVHSVNVSLGRQQQQLLLPELSPGTYLIKSRGERLEMSGRFVVVR